MSYTTRVIRVEFKMPETYIQDAVIQDEDGDDDDDE